MNEQLRNELIDKLIAMLQELKNDADAQIEVNQEIETVFKGFEYDLNRKHVRIDLYYGYENSLGSDPL